MTPRTPEPHRASPAGDDRVRVVSVGLSVTDPDAAVARILAWARQPPGRGRYVTLTNVHMVMEAHDVPTFADVVNGADLVLPDGMPTVWAQRLLGRREARRVSGPQLTERLLAEAARDGVAVAFYGGSDASLASLVEHARRRWPELRVAAAIAPPFRPPTADEDREFTRRLVESGARLVFVGIGCPKQERWMAQHVESVPAVMLGVGQAFDILSGLKRDAPAWMQRAALGWLFRLVQEPRRLWRRYAVHNPRYIALLIAQWARRRH